MTLTPACQSQFWVKTGDFPGVPGGDSTPVAAIVAARSGVLFAGTLSGNGLYRSLDTGRTWRVCAGMTWYTHCYSLSERADGAIVALTNRAAGGTDSTKVQVSRDNGATFTPLDFPHTIKASDICLDEGGNIFVATRSADIYRCFDGRSFTKVTNQSGYRLVKIRSFGDALLATTPADGIVISSDSGRTWRSWTSEFFFNTTYDIQVLSPTQVLVSSEFGAFVGAPQGAGGWRQIFGSLERQTRVRSAFNIGTRFFCAVGGEGSHYSPDGGAHWAQITSGLTSVNANAFSVDQQGRVLIASQHGVYVEQPAALSTLSPATIDIGRRLPGTVIDTFVVLRNLGSLPLVIDSIRYADPALAQIKAPSKNLGQTRQDTIGFRITTDSRDSVTARLFLVSNSESDNKECVVSFGLGQPSPVAEESRSSPSISYSAGTIRVYTHHNAEQRITIFDANGSAVGSFELKAQGAELSARVGEISDGRYFALLSSPAGRYIVPFVVW